MPAMVKVVNETRAPEAELVVRRHCRADSRPTVQVMHDHLDDLAGPIQVKEGQNRKPMTPEQLELWAANCEWANTIVAARGDTILGYADLDLHTQDAPIGCIDSLYIARDEANGNVIAKMLMDEIETMANLAGLTRLTCKADINQASYLKNAGFSEDEQEQVELRGCIVWRIPTTKQLQSP